jgi:hypothetical protein
MNYPVQKTALDITDLLEVNTNSVFGAMIEAGPKLFAFIFYRLKERRCPMTSSIEKDTQRYPCACGKEKSI